MGSKYIKKLAYSMMLMDNKEDITIKLSSGDSVICKIEDIDFIDIVELSDKGPINILGKNTD